MRACDIDGCNNKHVARGYCSTHYNKLVLDPAKRHGKYDIVCETCGVTYQSSRKAGRFCSDACKGAEYEVSKVRMSRLPINHPVRVLIRQSANPKSALRIAFESQDWDGIAQALKAHTAMDGDCWTWVRYSNRGYPAVRIAKREYSCHRLMAYTTHHRILPSHMPVHHTCANTQCINPDHLQVVTPHENVAEMLERNYYLDRIASLELALRDVAPHHSLLTPSVR